MTAFLDRVVAQALGIAPVVHRRREPIFPPAKRKDAGSRVAAAFEDDQPFDESFDAPRSFRRDVASRPRATAEDEREVPDDDALAPEPGSSRGGSPADNHSVRFPDSTVSGEVVSSHGQSSTSSSAPFAPDRDGNREGDGAKAIVPTVPIDFEALAREQAHPEFADAQTIPGSKGEGRKAAEFPSYPDVAGNRRPVHERSDPEITAGRTYQILSTRRDALPEDLGGSALDQEGDGPKSNVGPPKDAALSRPQSAARSDASSDTPVSSPRSVEDELTINVSIGRIDVAPSSPPPMQQPFVASPPRPSLADYMQLRQKIRGR